ncbi:hypothetical protein SK128_015077 [Halocaridina rubra]|uniref:Uncharacterized protein n=1 Tax=Halocaridina rubra TaxID=373956 RepID=A0AAN8ZZJ1_HALRR
MKRNIGLKHSEHVTLRKHCVKVCLLSVLLPPPNCEEQTEKKREGFPVRYVVFVLMCVGEKTSLAFLQCGIFLCCWATICLKGLREKEFSHFVATTPEMKTCIEVDGKVKC